jgi:hypothetical protein
MARIAVTSPPSPVVADDVVGRLRRNQVVILTGARGTAKKAVCDAVIRSHESECNCHQIDAGTVSSLRDLNGWLCSALGVAGPDLPGVSDLPEFDRPSLFVVRRLDRLASEPWLDAWQDTWRALFGAPEAGGMLTLLLTGRPRVQSALGGRGSPLLNIAAHCRVEPLNATALAESGAVDPAVARAVCRKTGGHPQMTLELIDRLGVDVKTLGAVTSDYIQDRFAFLCGLIDDHGEIAKRALADLSKVSGGRAAETVLQARLASVGDPARSGSFEDLVASGLLCRDDDGSAFLGAEILSAPSVKDYLLKSLAAITPPIRQPQDHAVAARLIYEFENVLRERVHELMLRTDKDTHDDKQWWTRRIQDQQAVAQAEIRKAAEHEAGVAPEPPLNVLCYMDLREVAAVVQQKDNWNHVFALGLHLDGAALSAGDFGGAIDDIALVRNKVAHNRPVEARDIERLRRAGRVLGFPMN